MDPDETLRAIQQLSDYVILGRRDCVVELATRFQELDEWLSRGGYSPSDWQ